MTITNGFSFRLTPVDAVFGKLTSIPCCIIGAVTIKIINNTSMTSTNGVTLISLITIFELFAGANTSEKVKDVFMLINTHIIVSFTETTAQYAGEIFRQLRSENKVIEFRDILIAATALEFGLPIKTINKRDFTRIKNLKLL